MKQLRKAPRPHNVMNETTSYLISFGMYFS